MFRSGRLLVLLGLLAIGVYAVGPALSGPKESTDSVKTGGAGIPLQINHQGVVVVGGTRFNGSGLFRFALVDPDSGNNVWTSDGTNVGGTGMPSGAVSLTVVNGIYNVALGDTDIPSMPAIPSDTFDDENLVLRIWFDDGQGSGVRQLAPDHELTSVPYAYRACHATTADAVVSSDFPSGGIIMWSGSVGSIPSGWAVCDGTNGTPNLTDRFIIGAGGRASPGSSGGRYGLHGADNDLYINTNHHPGGWTNAPSGSEMCGGHSHNLMPPYYALAFIMKL